MINFDSATKENIKEFNRSWPQIPDHPYRILLPESSGSRKTSALLNLIKKQDDDDYSIIDKIYLCINDSNEAKY